MEIEKKQFQLTMDSKKGMKEFLSREHLVEYLSKKLNMSEDEKKFANEFLRYHNYYSFSVFIKQIPKDMQKNIFYSAVTLYNFNEWLSNILFVFSSRLEQFIKATFVESICSNYKGKLQKGECYLDKNIYESEERYQEFISIMESNLSENKSLSIKHYIEEHNAKFPIWVLFQEMTFGETTRFISSLKKEYREVWIKETFLDNGIINSKIHGDEIKSKLFGWVSAVWSIRNRTAHNLRIYGLNFNVATPGFFSVDLRNINKEADVQKKKTHNSDLFAYLLAMKNLIQHHSNSFIKEWNTFLIELYDRIQNDSDIILESKMGLSSNWKIILEIKGSKLNTGHIEKMR